MGNWIAKRLGRLLGYCLRCAQEDEPPKEIPAIDQRKEAMPREVLYEWLNGAEDAAE